MPAEPLPEAVWGGVDLRQFSELNGSRKKLSLASFCKPGQLHATISEFCSPKCLVCSFIFFIFPSKIESKITYWDAVEPGT